MSHISMNSNTKKTKMSNIVIRFNLVQGASINVVLVMDQMTDFRFSSQ